MTDFTVPPVAHAIQRAKERYGIDLTWKDLLAIAKRCKAGEGYTGCKEDGSHFHTIVFGERVLWVIYRRPSPFKPDGIVVTIMPPEKGRATAWRDREHIIRRGGYRRRKDHR